MKEALIALAAILGSIAGIGVGQYLTQSASLMVASYTAPPQTISNTSTLRGIITRVDATAHTVNAEIPSPYGDAPVMQYRFAIDKNTSIIQTGSPGTSVAQQISSTLLNTPLSFGVDQLKGGTLYLRSIRPPVSN